MAAREVSTSASSVMPVSGNSKDSEIKPVKNPCRLVEATVNQKQVYFLQMASPNLRAFNIPLSITLTSQSPINVPTLLNNIRHSLEVNESLRVGFSIVTTIEQFTNELYEPYYIVDLTNSKIFEKEGKAKKEIESLIHGQYPFDKERSAYDQLAVRLYYTKVVIFNPKKVMVIVNNHCIVSDRLSMVTQAKQILGIWDSEIHCEITVEQQLQLSPSLVRLTPSSKDQESMYKMEVEKWKKTMSGTRKVLRMSDPGLPFVPDCEYEVFPLYIEYDMKLLARKLKITSVMLVHLATCLTLGTFMGMDDFLVGMVSDNRKKEELSFIGCYEKTMPLRIDFSQNPTLKELAKQFKENYQMVQESPLYMIDLVKHIPCIQHKPGSTTPFHVILSEFSYDEQIPKEAVIDGRTVKAVVNRNLQCYTHVDLIVELHPEPKGDNRGKIQYKYSKGCLSQIVVRTLHKKIGLYLEKMASLGPDEEITLQKYFPSLVNLSKWHFSKFSTDFSPLDLPTNVLKPVEEIQVPTEEIEAAQKPGSKADKPGGKDETPPDDPYTTVTSKTIMNEIHSEDDDDNLLGLLAYVVSKYTNQNQFGIIYIKKSKIFGLSFKRLEECSSASFERQLRSVIRPAIEESKGISLDEFSVMMSMMPKGLKTTFLVWCLDKTIKAHQLPVECGIHVNCERKSCIGTSLKLTGRAPWFDQEALKMIVKSFEQLYYNVDVIFSNSEEMRKIPYWPQDLKPILTVAHSNIPLKATYIEQLLYSKTNIKKDFIAMVHKNEYMTYDYMLEKVDQLTTVFINKYVFGEGYVGVYMKRSPWLFISMFTCLRATKPYVPISVKSSKEDIAKLVQEFNIKVIITDSSMLDQLVEIDVEVFCIDAKYEGIKYDTPLPPRASEEAVMCVQFKPSGDPSEPRKAVKLSHTNVLHAINNIMELTTASESRVTLASTSILYDAHIIDSLTPLLRGSCIVIVDDQSCIAPDVTHAFATPDAVCSVHFPSSVKSLVVGGDTFTEMCNQKTKHIEKVTYLYSPPRCIVFAASSNVYKPSDPNNIGNLTSGYGFQVKDLNGHIIQIGFPGILYLSGDMLVTHKYRHQYCTKDLVRFRPDKTIELLGRKENLVQVQDQVFELLPLEKALFSFPHVESACAFVHRQDTPNALLVAFVVPKNIPISPLLDHLKKSPIPLFMVPKVILAVDKLPFDEFGKIDKVKLHGIVDRRQSISVERIDKTVDLLSQVRSIFADVIGVKAEHYLSKSDFFKSGGDSELAVILINQLNACLDCETTLETLLSHPSPSDMLDYITKTMIRRVKLPRDDLSVQDGARRKSKTMGEIPDTEVKFYVKLDPKTERIEARNLFPKRNSNSRLQDIKPEIIKKFIEVTSTAPGKFSMKYLDKFDEENYEAHKVFLPKPRPCMTPIERYCHSCLPLEYLQLIFSPTSMYDFEFLADVPPFILHKESFTAGNYESIAEQLRRDDVKNITASIVQRYAENCDNPELVLVQHAKVEYFTSQTCEDPIHVMEKPSGTESPVFFVYMDLAGFSKFVQFSYTKKYKMPAVALRRTIHTPNTSMTKIAAYYVDAILKHQPEGPYKLVGRLYGATVAYEIAHQLVNKGHKIKLLVMIDDSPVQEKRPTLFDSYGRPVLHSSLYPTVFYHYLLALNFPYNILRTAPNKSLINSVNDALFKAYPWIFLDRQKLIDVYMNFFKLLKCQWQYKPKPTPNGIQTCLLIREKEHKFFDSKDFGLSKLVKNPIVIMQKPDVFDRVEVVVQALKKYL